MCLNSTENLPYTRSNGFSTDRPVLPIVTSEQRCYTQSIWLLSKRLSMSRISLHIKHRAKFNTEQDSIHIWGRRWPNWSILPPDSGRKIAAWHWRKRCWLSMHNKVKSGQSFSVKSAKRVPASHVCLKLVRKEAGAQLSNNDNKYSTFQGSKCS